MFNLIKHFLIFLLSVEVKVEPKEVAEEEQQSK